MILVHLRHDDCSAPNYYLEDRDGRHAVSGEVVWGTVIAENKETRKTLVSKDKQLHPGTKDRKVRELSLFRSNILLSSLNLEQ